MSRTLSIIGIALTIAYLGALWFLFDGRLVEIMLMKPNEIGDLLAGLFGPLAILWLILGFFQQGIELRQNTIALHLQAEELKKSVEQQREVALAANKQAEAMRDSQKPVFAISVHSWDGSRIHLYVRNTRHAANNVVIRVSFGYAQPIEQQIGFLPNQGSTDLFFNEAIHPGMRKAIGMEPGEYFVTLQFEYGNGLNGEENFDFQEDPHLGRFVNRKAALSGTVT